MSDNKILTQEEINALLNGGLTEEKEEAPVESLDKSDTANDQPVNVNVYDYLSPIEQDALGEIGNISLGNAATSLSILLGQEVDITTPSIEAILYSKLRDRFPKPHVMVNVDYTDGFQGINLLVLKEEDAKIIADLMMGGMGVAGQEDLSELHLSAVQEAMNQMMGSAATSMSTLFNRMVNISPPGIQVLDLAKENVEALSENIIITVSFRLKVGDLIDSNIMQLIPLSFAKAMVDILMGGVQETATASSQEPSIGAAPSSVPEPPKVEPVKPEPSKLEQPKQEPPKDHHSQPAAAAQSFSFSAFSEDPSVKLNQLNLNLLMDIKLQVSVELGRTTKKINEILDLSDGSVVELDKLSGEPVDILVNNKLVARGEVVVIDENFAVRLTEIVNPNERIKNLM